MIKKPMSYQPKGSMCMTCRHVERNCGMLPFHDMPVLEQYYMTAVVRCTEHARPMSVAKAGAA